MSGRRPGIAALLAVLALAASCAHFPARGPGAAAVFVERDATWSGEVRVDGIVHVRKGATLTILPGTRIAFVPKRLGTGVERKVFGFAESREAGAEPRDVGGAECRGGGVERQAVGSAEFRAGGEEHEGFTASGIRVEGRIVAEGTDEAPIVFTAADAPPFPGIWDKILFSFSTGNRFVHCTFEGARYAFHAHFSEISVRRCLFRDNEEGVRLGQSRVTIADSVFTRNEIRGINFRECRNEIRGNLVYGNGDGIFLHSRNSASVIRANAIYGNRGFDLRLGDLHAEDIDASENWWGTPREEDARHRVFDVRSLPGLGAVRLAPVLGRPSVAGAGIRGIFVSHMTPVVGAEVRAYASVADGLWTDAHAASATTGEDGRFALAVPPGRYFVVGRAESSAGVLFAFPGKNPVAADFGETTEVGLPSVVAPPRASAAPSSGGRSSIVVRATRDGAPAAGVTVQALRPGVPDFRGPGDASATTNEAGMATLFLPPGKYLLAAKKRSTGAALGMVDEGGLFGVYPYSPVDLPAETAVTVQIPLFEKRGWVGAVEAPEPQGAAEGGSVSGKATVGGGPAEGYIVFFYRPPETIGRPAARSSVVSASGAFGVSLPGTGEFLAYLRKSVPGVPGAAEEERIGPVSVQLGAGGFAPPVLSFEAAGSGAGHR